MTDWIKTADTQQILVALMKAKGVHLALQTYAEYVAAGLAPNDLSPWPEIRLVLDAPDRAIALAGLNVIVREAVELSLAYETAP